MNKITFIVYCPMAWTESSGGIIALHKLAHNIASLGEECLITTSQKNPKYKGAQVSEDAARKIAEQGNAIVIYPEVVKGNPLKSKYIMRWLLNTPGVISFCIDAKDYSKGHEYDADMYYKFAPAFKAPDESKVKGELRAMELFLDVFYDRVRERSCMAHIVRKGHNKPQTAHDYLSLSLDDYEAQGGNEYLAHVFSGKQVFVSYDHACFLSVQAALCGCLSIVIPDPKMSSKEWYDKFPYFQYGVAYGMENISSAIDSRPFMIEHLLKLESETIEQTKQFITETYALMSQ